MEKEINGALKKYNSFDEWQLEFYNYNQKNQDVAAFKQVNYYQNGVSPSTASMYAAADRQLVATMRKS